MFSDIIPDILSVFDVLLELIQERRFAVASVYTAALVPLLSFGANIGSALQLSEEIGDILR